MSADAAKFTFNGIGLAEFMRSSPMAAAILRAALPVERRAKHLCPVDTGRLRASITTRGAREPSGVPVALVGTNVDYARHVEFGTSRQTAKPFLRPALHGGRR